MVWLSKSVFLFYELNDFGWAVSWEVLDEMRWLIEVSISSGFEIGLIFMVLYWMRLVKFR